MIGQNLRRLGVASAVTLAFLGTPSESKAIFHWFSDCCGARSTYMPPVAVPAPAPACTSCAMPVPQYSYMPVTAYRSVYMPVVVPYTTYRPVYASACGSPCGFGGCATGACGVAAPAYVGAAPACDGCAAAPAPTYVPSNGVMNGGVMNGAPSTYAAPAPVTNGYGPSALSTPAPVINNYSPSTNYAPNSSAPAAAAPVAPVPQGSAPARTYLPAAPDSAKPVKPIPDTGTPAAPSSMPQLTSPLNRTTYQPPRQTWVYSSASPAPSAYSPTSYSVSRPEPESEPADDGGWRPARQ